MSDNSLFRHNSSIRVIRHFLPLLLVACGLGEAELAHAASRETNTAPHTSAPKISSPAGDMGLFGPDRRKVALPNRLSLFRNFGVRWVRFNSSVPISPSNGMSDPEESTIFHNAGIKIFISAVAAPSLRQGKFDYSSYQAYSSLMVKKYKPDIVAAGNEIDNQGYDGSLDNYLGEVRALCQSAHENGAKCTDSGLTTKVLLALYLDRLISSNSSPTSNISTIRSLLNEWYGASRGPGYSQSDWQSFKAREHISEADMMLRNLKQAGADYVNIHWYSKSDGVVTENVQNSFLIPAVATMLREKSGLPVVGGEVGIEGPSGSDASLSFASIANEIRALKCSTVSPIIFWSPGVGGYTGNSRALSPFDGNGKPFSSASGLRQSMSTCP